MPHQRFKKRRLSRHPQLSLDQILAWADAYHERMGRWPQAKSGRIPGSLGENWFKIENALKVGYRGLPGKSSLAQLLAERRGVRNIQRLPPFTIKQILAWADAHHRATGEWPGMRSGPIFAAPEETWLAVERALKGGYRGLAGGSSLAQLLNAHRPSRDRTLRIEQILRWADECHRRTGKWPTINSGPVGPPGAGTWRSIEMALFQGLRGLPGGSSLARLLAERRGKRNHMGLPRLTLKQILGWADRHHQRTGKWPGSQAGPVAGVPGQTWSGVEATLRMGLRGLPGGTSIALMLAEYREVRNQKRLPPLRKNQILRWAKAHFRRTGGWPKRDTGPIPEMPGETWWGVYMALRRGSRGLKGKSSLAILIRRGHKRSAPRPGSSRRLA
jgi:hypothetical protein